MTKEDLMENIQGIIDNLTLQQRTIAEIPDSKKAGDYKRWKLNKLSEIKGMIDSYSNVILALNNIKEEPNGSNN
jgi:hypothetical protein